MTLQLANSSGCLPFRYFLHIIRKAIPILIAERLRKILEPKLTSELYFNELLNTHHLLNFRQHTVLTSVKTLVPSWSKCDDRANAQFPPCKGSS